jgi:hypothetical protein
MVSRYRRAIKEVLEKHVKPWPAARVVPLNGNAFVEKGGGLHFTVGVGVETRFV